MTVLAAMGQLFYSMSLAMGIMVTYGSYMKKDVNLDHAVQQIEIFDTGHRIDLRLNDCPGGISFLRRRRVSDAGRVWADVYHFAEGIRRACRLAQRSGATFSFWYLLPLDLFDFPEG